MFVTANVSPGARRSLVSIAGELDASVSLELYRALGAAVDASDAIIVVDLARVDSIDSKALNALLGAAKRAYGRGKIVALQTSASPAVTSALKTAGLRDEFEWLPPGEDGERGS